MSDRSFRPDLTSLDDRIVPAPMVRWTRGLSLGSTWVRTSVVTPDAEQNTPPATPAAPTDTVGRPAPRTRKPVATPPASQPVAPPRVVVPPVEVVTPAPVVVPPPAPPPVVVQPAPVVVPSLPDKVGVPPAVEQPAPPPPVYVPPPVVETPAPVVVAPPVVVAAPAPQPAGLPGVNQAVLDFARQNVGVSVDPANGADCWDFANAALVDAGAKSAWEYIDNGPAAAHHTWGNLVFQRSKVGGYAEGGTFGDILPGDVMQLDLYMQRCSDGSMCLAPHHTAVVESVNPATGAVQVIHQNWNGNLTGQRGEFKLADMTQGVVSVYRPQA